MAGICRRIAFFGVALALVSSIATAANAQVKVRGYTRKDGTHVQTHSRSKRDGILGNTSSTFGNANLFTNEPGTNRTPPMGFGGRRNIGLTNANANIPANAGIPTSFPMSNFVGSGNDNSGSLYSSADGSSSWLSAADREREYRRELMAQRRDDEAARRDASRKSIPYRFFWDEDYAKSKYNVAHMLYKNGNLDAARRVLTKLIDEYPETDMASRAKSTLEKF